LSGERYYTTKIWQRPSSIGFSSAGALSTSMDPPGEPVISTWKRPCQKIQNGSEFPELVAQNFRNPQHAKSSCEHPLGDTSKVAAQLPVTIRPLFQRKQNFGCPPADENRRGHFRFLHRLHDVVPPAKTSR